MITKGELTTTQTPEAPKPKAATPIQARAEDVRSTIKTEGSRAALEDIVRTKIAIDKVVDNLRKGDVPPAPEPEPLAPDQEVKGILSNIQNQQKELGATEVWAGKGKDRQGSGPIMVGLPYDADGSRLIRFFRTPGQTAEYTDGTKHAEVLYGIDSTANGGRLVKITGALAAEMANRVMPKDFVTYSGERGYEVRVKGKTVSEMLEDASKNKKGKMESLQNAQDEQGWRNSYSASLAEASKHSQVRQEKVKMTTRLGEFVRAKIAPPRETSTTVNPIPVRK